MNNVVLFWKTLIFCLGISGHSLAKPNPSFMALPRKTAREMKEAFLPRTPEGFRFNPSSRSSSTSKRKGSRAAAAVRDFGPRPRPRSHVQSTAYVGQTLLQTLLGPGQHGAAGANGVVASDPISGSSSTTKAPFSPFIHSFTVCRAGPGAPHRAFAFPSPLPSEKHMLTHPSPTSRTARQPPSSLT